jgi:hypothetical protein
MADQTPAPVVDFPDDEVIRKARELVSEALVESQPPDDIQKENVKNAAQPSRAGQ